jgi:hypothetical protein
MTVPNRAEHPNRKMGDHTTPLHEYVLTVKNSNSPSTVHPNVEHAVKQAAYTAHKEGRQNAVGASIQTPHGYKEYHSVQPMNTDQAKAHLESVKVGDYRTKTVE